MELVDRLEATDQIRQLKARYWRCVDTQNWSDMATVLDAAVAVDLTDAGGGTYTSAEAFITAMTKGLRGAVSSHQGGGAEINIVSGTEAVGTWAFTDHIEYPNRILDGAGRYDETYRNTADGWRIASTRLTRHWVNVTRPGAEKVVADLLYQYARKIDRGDYAGVAALFTHGRIAYEVDAPVDQQIVGADAVLASYQSTTRLYDDGTPKSKHVTTNVAIEVDHVAGSATAHSYYTVLQQTADLSLQPIIAGEYFDSFHIVDGTWWFDTRIIGVNQLGDLSHHLLFDL